MKKTIKLAAFVLAAIMLVITATGCGQAIKQPAPSDVTAKVLEAIEIPSATEKNTTTVGDYYKDIDTSVIKAMSMYICGSGAYPDELAVIQLNDEAACKDALKSMQNHLDSQVELYTDYTPDEMYKLNTAFCYSKGNYCIYIATSDNTKAKELIEGCF